MNDTCTTDLDLLRRYARDRSDDAFAEIVHRHIAWVYSTCRRQVHDASLAEDTTQFVFIALARKAPDLSDAVSITGWLFTTARYASAAALKIQRRRCLHERQAASMKRETTPHDVEQHWQRIEPILDHALARLNAADREALILRFFRGMSHHAIGTSLHISEDAAKKRVTRAVDRLRKTLGSAATALPAGTVATLLSELFKTPTSPNVQTIPAREYFEKKYPLDGALFTKKALGQIFAVHEAAQDPGGCYHIICSSRVAPDVRPALGDPPDDQPLTQFMMDDRAQLPFQYLKLAEFQESGLQVTYLLAVPHRILAPDNICQLPVTAGSADLLLTAAHVHYSDHSGHDVHFPLNLEVPLKPNAPTLHDFASRAYDETTPLVGVLASQSLIGPRTDAGLSTRAESLAEMEKQLALFAKGDQPAP